MKRRIFILSGPLLMYFTAIASADTGPSSSNSPYLLSVPDGPASEITSILTTGDNIGGYRMSGIPDGLGAFDNLDGTFTVVMNHEIPGGLGVTRAHGAPGAFVSSWVIDKTTLQVNSGHDLIQSVYGWNSTLQASDTSPSTVTFQRFCSADLAPVSSLYYAPNGGPAVGTQARIFMNGEEIGSAAHERQQGTVVTGPDAGKSYTLGKFNLDQNGSGIAGAYSSEENGLANPFSQLKTVVAINSDGGTGIYNNAVGMYVGTKQSTGSEVDKAGLTNGTLKFINVAGNTAEITDTTNRTTSITSGTRFGLNGTASTTFARPEDGAWNPLNPAQYYFVTTDQLDTSDLASPTTKGGTRLWRLTFDDITNPDAGGRIDKLLDSTTLTGTKGPGTPRPNMFDNITVNKDGTISLCEDVGAANHNGKVWLYDPSSNSLTKFFEHDLARFGELTSTGGFVAGSHTNDEETSGILDVTDVLGRNDGKIYNLIDVQDHASESYLRSNGFLTGGTTGEFVEGGQLLLVTVPEPGSLTLFGLGAAVSLLRRRRSR